ncbi:MAG: putative membrane protein [Francisellaceae bacterium]|jgi:putative membrane protein
MKQLKDKNFNPFYWLTIFIIVVKSDISKKFRYFHNLGYLIFFLIIYALIISLVESRYHAIGQSTDISSLLVVFNFIIGLLLVFRLNTAYARWWDGRGQWGFLVNNCRNLAIKFDNYVGLNKDPLFRDCLSQFPALLKFHLRKEWDSSRKLVSDLGLTYVDDHHLPNLVIHRMSKILNHYRKNGTITFEQYLAAEENLSAMTDILGACEKIRNTPVPAGYAFFIKLALFVYMLLFPLDWVDSFSFWIMPIVIIIIYTMLGIEILAEEMEEPFGYDSNDLKLDSLSATIRDNVLSISKLSEESIYTPK